MLSEPALSILHAARQAYVGVATDTTPHVTPVLYAPTATGIAFPTAASTLKGRKLRKGTPIGVAVRSGNRAVVFSGAVHVVDPKNPASVLATLRERGPELATATASFAARNGIDLAGFARDAVTGRLPFRRLDRRLFVFVDADEWDVLDDLSGPGEDAAVACGRGHNQAPLVLPAQWDASSQKATVPTQPLRQWHEGPAAVVVDDYGAPGPAAKKGVLLRGAATAAPDGAVTTLAFDTERVAAWADAETASVTVEQTP